MEKSLYINVADYIDRKYPFQIFTGGRGTGKTYSAIDLCVKSNRPFLWMRRTQTELETILDSEKTGESGNTFKAYNKDKGTNLGMKLINKNLAGIYDRELDKEGRFIYGNSPRGYGIAMSTLAKLRGIDLSDAAYMVYDEFIPEKHIQKMRNECDALLNGYETVARNRELDGKPPLPLIMLSNSNDIYNPIFVGLNIVADVEKMCRKNQHDKYYPDRGLAVHLLEPSQDFVEKKSKTAIMKLTKGTTFADMALSNTFAYDDFSLIGYEKLTGYIPVCNIDNAYIYRKKGEAKFYVSYSPCRTIKFTSKVEHDAIRFRREYGAMLQTAYIAGQMLFESYALKMLVLDSVL